MAVPPRKRQQLTKSTWVPTDTLESIHTGTPYLSLGSTTSEVQEPCETILQSSSNGNSSSRTSSSRGSSMDRPVNSGTSAAAPPALSDSEDKSEDESEIMVDFDQQDRLSCGTAPKATTGYPTGIWQSSPGSDLDSSMGSAATQTQAGYKQSCPNSPSTVSDSDSLLLAGVKGICCMEVDEGGCSEGTEDLLGRMFEDFRQGKWDEKNSLSSDAITGCASPTHAGHDKVQ